MNVEHRTKGEAIERVIARLIDTIFGFATDPFGRADSLEVAMPFKHILIPTDGSELSRSAIAAGMALAAEHRAKVTGLYVGEFPVLLVKGGPSQVEQALVTARTTAREYLGEIEQAASDADVGCETYYDDAGRSIADAVAHHARTRRCDLVVMATHGRHGFAAVFNPSQTKRVVSHAKIPIMVVHGRERPDAGAELARDDAGRDSSPHDEAIASTVSGARPTAHDTCSLFKHILVPTDGTERAQHAVRAAIEFARDEHARITGFFPIDSSRLRPRFHGVYMMPGDADLERELAERVRMQGEDALQFIQESSQEAGFQCETRLEFTDLAPYEAIIREADQEHCDLIAMAALAPGGFAGLFEDGPANKVMTYAKVPVLLYPARASH